MHYIFLFSNILLLQVYFLLFISEFNKLSKISYVLNLRKTCNYISICYSENQLIIYQGHYKTEKYEPLLYPILVIYFIKFGAMHENVCTVSFIHKLQQQEFLTIEKKVKNSV